MWRKFILAISLLFLALSISISTAQEAIGQGETKRGDITDTIPQRTYIYSAQGVEVVTVEVISITDGFAPQFTVTDLANNLVNAVGNPTAASTVNGSVTFPVGGAYNIIVAGTGTGSFVITVNGDGAAPPPPQATLAPPTDAPLTCGQIVSQALQVAQASCTGMGRDEACYGNVILRAEPQPDARNFQFEAAGDREDVAEIASMRLSSLDVAEAVWGVAMMRLQASLPDSDPNQNVDLVLFGNVQIQNAGEDEFASGQTEIGIVARQDVNIRQLPVNTSEIVGVFLKDETSRANGRDETGWIRVVFSDDAGQTQVGWVWNDFLRSETGTFDSLAIVNPGDAVAPASYGPMQAFYLQTGVDDAPCEEAPDSGLLIQTPDGVGQITMLINEVVIDLGSTAYVQANAGSDMTINMLEGTGSVTAQNTTVPIVGGTRVRVGLDTTGAASSPPSPPEPYEQNPLQKLPVALLPVTVPVTPPLTQEEIDAILGPTSNLPELPTDGSCVLATEEEIRINARRGPSTDYDILSNLDPLTIYNVTGRNEDSTWWQLTFSNVGNVWVAGSVTRLGGNCNSVPIASYPPPPTALAPTLPAPITPTIPGDSDGDGIMDRSDECPNEFGAVNYSGCPNPIASNNEITLNLDSSNSSMSAKGQISYPLGDNQDTVSYTVAPLDISHFQGLEISFSCSGTGTGDVSVFVNPQGGTPNTVTCPDASTASQIIILSDRNATYTGNITFSISGGDGAYVDWNINIRLSTSS